MAICWVRAGECGKETTITARKKAQTHASIQVDTTCERIAELAKEIPEVDIGPEMTKPMRDTDVYRAAEKHCCRNSCIVPAAILKTVEVAGNIFPPEPAQIEFLEDAL